nr:MAG TPA: hypothetical protein [Caudoviricetes sp.]
MSVYPSTTILPRESCAIAMVLTSFVVFNVYI